MFFCSFSVLDVIFCRKENGEKDASKMLMKFKPNTFSILSVCDGLGERKLAKKMPIKS